MVTGKEEGSKCGSGEKFQASSFAGGFEEIEKAGDEGLNLRREAVNLDVNVLLAPDEGNSRQPVLLFDRGAGAGPVLRKQDSCHRRELRAGDFASYRARCDPHLGIIQNTLVFPGVAPTHDIELIVQFSKPDRRRYRDPAFAEGGEANVFLLPNFARDGHGDYCTGDETVLFAAVVPVRKT